MQEAEALPGNAGQALYVLASFLQQVECPFNVGVYKIFSAVNGAVHVALSSEMNDGAGLVVFQQSTHQGAVTNVTVHKNVTLVMGHAGKIGQIAGIGEFVEIHDGRIFMAQPMQDEI
jgi:hypothetical protein